MPRWTLPQTVPGSFGVRAGGAGVVLAPGEAGQDLHVYYVDHAIDTDAERSQAWWCHRRGMPLDRAGNVRGWSAVRSHVTGQLLPVGYFAVSNGPFSSSVYPRFSFVGAGVTRRADGKVLFFDRFRHHVDGPDKLSEQLGVADTVEAAPAIRVVSLVGEAADVTVTFCNLTKPGQEDLVAFHLQGSGPFRAYYRIGWDCDPGALDRPRGGWSADKPVPGDFPTTGLGVALVRWGTGKHLLFFSLERSSGAFFGRYRIGYDVDENGDVRRFGPWIRVPGAIVDQLQGLAVTVGDVEGDGRPDLVVFRIANNGGNNTGVYQVGFDLLDLGAFAAADAPPPLTAIHARSPVAVTSWSEGRLDLVGVGANGAIQQKCYEQRWWPDPTGWTSIGGGFSGPPRAISWGPGRLDLVAVGTDGSMYQKAWEGRWWPSPDGWSPIGGQFIAAPTLVSWGPNRLDIFGVGTDAQLFQKVWDGQRWQPSASGWHALGGRFLHPVAALSRGAGTLEIFGVGADGAMYSKAWWTSAWSPAGVEWSRLGGRFISAPAVASWGPKRLDVVAVGSDGAMHHKTWDSNRWFPSTDGWSSLGGQFSSAPALVTLGPGSLHVFGVGGDDGMYHMEWNGYSWSEWRALGGKFIAAPVAIGRGARIDVFSLGTDGGTYQRFWTAAQGWQPSAWVPLGVGPQPI